MRDSEPWDIVKTPPAPKLDHPTMADMFAYLLEVEGHRDLDPNKVDEYGYAIAPYHWCGVFSGDRASCPSCVALRLHRLGIAEEQSDERTI